MQTKARVRLRGLALVLIAALSACGGDGAVEETARPVLVERPRVDAVAAGSSAAQTASVVRVTVARRARTPVLSTTVAAPVGGGSSFVPVRVARRTG